ncbi:uncharacterized protein LOC110015985 isoform X2 [Oryzias latipes]
MNWKQNRGIDSPKSSPPSSSTWITTAAAAETACPRHLPCFGSGGSCLVVRLDIWYLMRRFASGVTTESHQLHPTFMRQLSHCIFQVDPGGARRLTQAKRSQLEGKHGMIQRVSKEEWRLHCRRRTRGAEKTALLTQNLLDTFSGPAGPDTLDIQLLDAFRIEEIWSTQDRHLNCIHDWPRGGSSTPRLHLRLQLRNICRLSTPKVATSSTP